jgi:hypothetical protein
MSCEKKELLESVAGRASLGTSFSSIQGASNALVEAVAPMGREILRVEATGDDKELRKHFSSLLKVPLGDIGRIRMTPQKQPALIDVISIVTRKPKNDSAEVWRRLEKQSRAVKANCFDGAFPGNSRRTPIAKDLKTLIQVIFMLPGREASTVRQAAAEVFIRFMGGDLSLIQDVQKMNEVQSFLKEHDPEHPMRIFGESVESSERTEVAPASQTPVPRAPPNPVIMKAEDSIGLPGSDHLYAASRLEDNILKIGVSKDVVERMPELSRSFQAGYALQAVWPGEAALEEIVLEKLKPYKATVGSSREHFDSRVTLEYLCQIVDHARALYKTKMELSYTSFEQRKRELEFQEDLKDLALKRRREELELETYAAKLDAERNKLESDKQREKLLHDLVREKHPEAIEVFLETCKGMRNPTGDNGFDAPCRHLCMQEQSLEEPLRRRVTMGASGRAA